MKSKTKRGRPKCERKALDIELFKKCKGVKDLLNPEVDRHAFQQIKYQTFKQGKYIMVTVCSQFCNSVYSNVIH